MKAWVDRRGQTVNSGIVILTNPLCCLLAQTVSLTRGGIFTVTRAVLPLRGLVW